MRTIEKNMNAAISAGRNWAAGNTSVTFVNNEVQVRLHGNLIAVRDAAGVWRYSLAGWNTTTTRSRLNALGCNVTQKNFTPLRDGREWWSDFAR